MIRVVWHFRHPTLCLATRCVIKMLARWAARLKCGYPCLSLLFLITDFAAVFSPPCDFHRWQNKCYRFVGMDQERTSQRSPVFRFHLVVIFAKLLFWVLSQNLTIVQLLSEWSVQNRDIFLMISFDVLSKLITEFRRSSLEKLFFFTGGKSNMHWLE